MSTPATNWSYTSVPPVNKGSVVPVMTIGHATMGSTSITKTPIMSVPGNMYYFKAYGGDSTDSGSVAEWLVADPISSSAFSLSTGKYTAPVNGFYRFAGVCYSGGPDGVRASLRRVRGESNITLNYVAVSDTWGESSSFNTEVLLEAGDEVFVYVDEGRLRLADYNAESFTLESLTYQPRSTFEGRIIYETA
jgi:hypothetical protein